MILSYCSVSTLQVTSLGTSLFGLRTSSGSLHVGVGNAGQKRSLVALAALAAGAMCSVDDASCIAAPIQQRAAGSGFSSSDFCCSGGDGRLYGSFGALGYASRTPSFGACGQSWAAVWPGSQAARQSWYAVEARSFTGSGSRWQQMWGSSGICLGTDGSSGAQAVRAQASLRPPPRSAHPQAACMAPRTAAVHAARRCAAVLRSSHCQRALRLLL